ncbi:MAG TPA: hypothetical protein VKT72_02720, partial [Candidatus Baltobacteraceae bacterium]|nr:hypothetical protein [Candidatus Baltobacteraceae bacterium]
MKYRITLSFGFLAAVLLATLAPACATTIEQDITAIGHSITVPADEEVKGDVTVIGGNADIAGTVDGDVTVVGGTLTKEPGAQIAG